MAFPCDNRKECHKVSHNYRLLIFLETFEEKTG